MVKKKSAKDAFIKSLANRYKETLEQSKLKLALLKENFEYQAFFTNFLDWDQKTKNKEGRFWPMREDFRKFGLVGLRDYLLTDEIIDLINPEKDISTSPDMIIDEYLPRLFYDHKVEQIDLWDELYHYGAHPMKPIRGMKDQGLKPLERIYKVDLSKTKKQIMKEFEGYLDGELSKRVPYNQREQSETWNHLNVWRLRKQRKNFSEIAKILDITTDAAKKSFYCAYEMTQHKRYDPAFLKKEIWEVEKREIKKTCANCPDRTKCTDLCPEVLPYVDQDHICLRDDIPAKENRKGNR